MPWAAAAAVAGAAITSSSARSAASQQADAAGNAAEIQNAHYQQTREDQAPFREAGVAATKRLTDLLSNGGDLSRRFNAADLSADPVYNSGLQFGLEQGTGGINARALGMGNYDSGATLKALTRFGNDYGSTKANESYNRFNTDMTNLYNRNAGVAGMGQTATNQVQAAGTNAANMGGDLMTQAGNARAAGIVGQGSAWADAIGGGYKGYQNQQSNNQLSSLMNNQSFYNQPSYYQDAF